ncbi:MAG: family 10 glycosylhydrolase, partial [Clostridia bacterium]|nr:family 10 glycosylhydrolase [Clostridia bacterium]
MTKRTVLIIGFLIAIILTFTLSGCNKDFDVTNNEMTADPGSTNLVGIINPDSEIRGVWIASTYNIDYPSRTDLSADQLKAELDAILDTCSEVGLNTIFFQVRPTADALYDSDIFPVSSVMNTNGKLVFDPLEYLVNEGHRRNIYIHAWVNPLRITMNSHDLDALPEMSPAKKNPDWVVPYDDGKLYFNAGIPEVWQLVADGVEEIVRKYDVDGVVFDDYFYPYPVYDDAGAKIEFDDSEEYEKYGAGYDNIGDWRRDNINKMVKLCYDTVHATDPECVFGISPFG